MQNLKGIFGFETSGQLDINATIGSYAQDLGYEGPLFKILRIDGVGEFVIPDDTYAKVKVLTAGKDFTEEDIIRLFLREMLQSKFDRIA